jgi:hypothetical protein
MCPIASGLLTQPPCSATLAPEHVRAFYAQCDPCSTVYEGFPTDRTLGFGNHWRYGLKGSWLYRMTVLVVICFMLAYAWLLAHHLY